jgi:hypothetical protein
MMGDGTEEQNLGQAGNPAARIRKDEVDAAFSKNAAKTKITRLSPIAVSSHIKAGPDRARPCHAGGMPMTECYGDA